MASDAPSHSSQLPLAAPSRKKKLEHLLQLLVLATTSACLDHGSFLSAEKWVRGSLRAEDQAVICSLPSGPCKPCGLCCKLYTPAICLMRLPLRVGAVKELSRQGFLSVAPIFRRSTLSSGLHLTLPSMTATVHRSLNALYPVVGHCSYHPGNQS